MQRIKSGMQIEIENERRECQGPFGGVGVKNTHVGRVLGEDGEWREEKRSLTG